MTKMITEMDLHALWKDLDVYDKELNAESKKLQDIWKSICEVKYSLETELKSLTEKPEFDFLPKDNIIQFNIGGQSFDAAVGILIKDPASTLAICCRKNCLFKKDIDGKYFFDRDWWLFRLILSFLRSNILPSDVETLKELYKEAAFYHLESLKQAIETVPIHQISQTLGASKNLSI